LAGLHLLPLARRGTRVTVITRSAGEARLVERVYERAQLSSRLETRVGGDLPTEGRFDVVLGFNALPLAPRWREYLAHQLALAGEVMVFVTNPASWGARIRRAVDALRGPRPALYAHESMQLEHEIDAMAEVVDRAWVDAPWWPDLFVPTGHTLLSGTVGRFFGRLERGSPFTYDVERWPWLDGTIPLEIRKVLRRHPTFERGPRRFGRAFAHHRAYRIRPKL
jgi:hypothetical protein